MEPAFVPCQLHRGGGPLRSETVLYDAGLRVLTFATTSAELLMQLVSVYLGDDRVDRVLVTEAIEWPQTDVPEFRNREIAVPAGFVTHGRARALEDHLGAFCELAERAYAEPFEIADPALIHSGLLATTRP